jgi:hypothetical protein
MNNQNLIIGGLVLTVLYLLKKNKQTTQQDLKTVTLENNATSLIDNGDQYKLCIYSKNPIKAELIKKITANGVLPSSIIRLDSLILDKKIISGIPNTI